MPQAVVVTELTNLKKGDIVEIVFLQTSSYAWMVPTQYLDALVVASDISANLKEQSAASSGSVSAKLSQVFGAGPIAPELGNLEWLPGIDVEVFDGSGTLAPNGDPYGASYTFRAKVPEDWKPGVVVAQASAFAWVAGIAAIVGVGSAATAYFTQPHAQALKLATYGETAAELKAAGADPNKAGSSKGAEAIKWWGVAATVAGVGFIAFLGYRAWSRAKQAKEVVE